MGREARALVTKGVAGLTHHKVSAIGLPGDRGHLIVHNEFVAGDPRNAVPLGGGIGKYRVIFTLARPGYFPVGEWEFSFAPDIPGDSHLAIASPALHSTHRPNEPIVAMHVDIATAEGQVRFTCRPNKRGFLGRVEMDIDATSLADAEQRAHRLLTPTLSNWSAQLDIPLHIWRTHVTAAETGETQISVVNPFPDATVLVGIGVMSPEYRAFASLYREALESGSTVYQFLCLYKMAEGMLFVRRPRLAKEAKARGENFTRPDESVPDNPIQFIPWLNAVFPNRRQWDDLALESIFVGDARGRKFADLLMHEPRDVRDAVAHALSDSTGAMLVSADEALHLNRVNRWIPLLKYIVRRLLKNELPQEYLPFLNEDGTIVS